MGGWVSSFLMHCFDMKRREREGISEFILDERSEFTKSGVIED